MDTGIKEQSGRVGSTSSKKITRECESGRKGNGGSDMENTKTNMQERMKGRNETI